VKTVPVKRHTSSTVEVSPISPAAVLVKEPTNVLSVKPVVSPTSDDGQYDIHTASSTTLTTATGDHHLSEEDEVDCSSQPQSLDNSIQSPVSTAQYFVSSSGNQPLKKLPELHKAARYIHNYVCKCTLYGKYAV